MRRKTLMNHLEKRFDLTVGTTEEFDGNNAGGKGGIWIRDNIASLTCNLWLKNYAWDSLGTAVENNVLNKFLEKNGWFAEPYDAETIMLYSIFNKKLYSN